MASERGGSTNPTDNPFGTVNSGNPEGRGGSTNDPKGQTSDRALGTTATHPTSKLGKPSDTAAS